MKKIFFSVALVFLGFSGFGQDLKPVALDSLVTVSLPSGYQKKDTLGEQIYSANSMYGYMAVLRESNARNNTPLKKERDLNKVMKQYIKGIQAQSDGSVAENVRDTTVGSLKAKVFTLKSGDGTGNITYRNFLLLYTRGATYTFEYVYPDIRSDMVKGEYRDFISSIKLSPQLQRNDQYLSNENGLSPVAKIGIFGGGGILILLMVFLLVRKKNAVNPA